MPRLPSKSPTSASPPTGGGARGSYLGPRLGVSSCLLANAAESRAEGLCWLGVGGSGGDAEGREGQEEEEEEVEPGRRLERRGGGRAPRLARRRVCRRCWRRLQHSARCRSAAPPGDAAPRRAALRPCVRRAAGCVPGPSLQVSRAAGRLPPLGVPLPSGQGRAGSQCRPRLPLRPRRAPLFSGSLHSSDLPPVLWPLISAPPPPSEAEGGVGVPSSAPPPFLSRGEFLPPGISRAPRKGQPRAPEEKPRLPAARSWQDRSLAGRSGREAAAGGAGRAPGSEDSPTPWEKPRRSGTAPLRCELLEHRGPGGEGCCRRGERAAGQRCGSGSPAASSAEPGRPPPRPVSTARPPARSPAPEPRPCRIEVPPWPVPSPRCLRPGFGCVSPLSRTCSHCSRQTPRPALLGAGGAQGCDTGDVSGKLCLVVEMGWQLLGERDACR